jgi:signal transduction histidine kinase
MVIDPDSGQFGDEGDDILFAAEETSTGQSNGNGWKVMIVDDDVEIHHITELSLAEFSFEDQGLSFINAYSGQEAQRLIESQPDIALILLDVVMETDDAGLQTVKYIRETLGNPWVRIVLRTGQPGQAPEAQVIVDYDINDYKAKTELTRQKLVTTVVTALRTFHHVTTIEHQQLENARLSAELIEHNRTLARKVEERTTELAQAMRQAEEARAAAEQANQAKSAFLANMSHELRTPLNAILGFTRIVRRRSDGLLPVRQLENLDKVLISGEHLLALINTILDIAKIEAGRMDVSPTTFPVEALLDICLTTAQPLLRESINLVKEIEADLPTVFSDQDKLKQILLNLLSNAAKFTHSGQIVVSARLERSLAGEHGSKETEGQISPSAPLLPGSHDGILSISVTDTGIGMSEEALGRIFEEFQQAESTTARQYGGTGLGLSISRKLARLLGGDLTAASRLGTGSTFTLIFPPYFQEKAAFTESYSGSRETDK